MYPTKEMILENAQTHKPQVIKKVLLWKKEVWKTARQTEDTDTRFLALKLLLTDIATKHYDKPVTVLLDKDMEHNGKYLPTQQTIVLGNDVSIITALHELAHHLFGANETKACRWSIWLFKKTFPKAYDKLEWQGHMLKKHQE